MAKLLGELLRTHDECRGEEKQYLSPISRDSTLLIRWDCVYAHGKPAMWNYLPTGQRVSSQVVIFGGDLEDFTFWPKKWMSFSDEMQLRMTRLWLPRLVYVAKRMIDEER